MKTKSKDYSAIKDVFRPAHADFTYQKKYGVRDYRGGGRSSARETTMRVAAGAIAKKYLAQRRVIRNTFGIMDMVRALIEIVEPVAQPIRTAGIPSAN